MKILISGATGLVGSELGKKLVAKGHEIYVLTRSPEKANQYCPFPQTPVSWDEFYDNTELENLDCIIHLAGTSLFDQRWNKKFKDKIYHSRVDTTKRLVEFANKKTKKLKAFISTSAVGIYGEADDKPITEEAPKSYSFLGKVCQEWESPLEKLMNARGVIFRVGIVFSEKGGALSEMVPPIQMGYGGPLGSGKQFTSWIDIDDLVNMYVFAIENDIYGVYNAVSPNPKTNKEITQWIAKHLSKKAFLPVPLFALRLVMGEVAPHLVESQTISADKILSKGFKFENDELEKSLTKRVPKLSGTEKRVIYEQWVPKSKSEVFEFFSDAKNLETITPPSLNFKILNMSTDKIESGSIINYKLKIDGIPIKWRTLIKDWDPPHMFSDNQEKGPYTKWYHIHRFEDLGGGTLMTDQVDFKIPLGLSGKLIAGWKVVRDVQKIFQFRRETIDKIYK